MPIQHCEYSVVTDIPTDEVEPSQHCEYHLADVSTDEESDYSIGEVSLISECESVHLDNDDNVDVDDDGEEVDVFQIDPNGLIGGKVELVSQDTGNPNNITVPVDGHQISECDVLVPDTSTANSLMHGSPLDTRMEVEATQGSSSEVCQTETTVARNMCNAPMDGNGYVWVIDNLDMNVRHSFQRIN